MARHDEAVRQHIKFNDDTPEDRRAQEANSKRHRPKNYTTADDNDNDSNDGLIDLHEIGPRRNVVRRRNVSKRIRRNGRTVYERESLPDCVTGFGKGLTGLGSRGGNRASIRGDDAQKVFNNQENTYSGPESIRSGRKEFSDKGDLYRMADGKKATGESVVGKGRQTVSAFQIPANTTTSINVLSGPLVYSWFADLRGVETFAKPWISSGTSCELDQ